jgi:hypothetical protein
MFGKSSGFSASINASSLDGSNGFRLVTDEWQAESGWSVAGAGDINGDGFADVIIGNPGVSPHGAFSGSSYVVFGKASGFATNVDLSTLDGRDGFRLDGVGTHSQSGSSVSGAGDVNGDGFADLIVGAHGADAHGDSSGSSYVVFGKASGFPKRINLSTLDGSNGFRLDGVAAFDESGWSVSGAGDVNGDGVADLIVGAPGAGPHGYSSGSSYVLFGKASGFVATVDLSTLDGSNGFRLDGVSAFERSGWAVSGAGDVNGDGFADLIVGAPGAGPHGNSSGSSYLMFGKASGFNATVDLSALDGSNGFRLDGVAAGDNSGRSVSGAGDVNGDGFDDVIVGADRANANGKYSGSSYIVFGKRSAFPKRINLSTLDGGNGFRLDGASRNDFSGHSVAGAGDVNGDGFADVIVGVPDNISAGAHQGKGSSYVVFGRAPDTATIRTGSGTSQYISGGAFGDTLKGHGGKDALEGRGGPDILIGGTEGDTAFYLHATAGVRASLTDPAVNTGEAAGDSYARLRSLTGSRFADELIGDGERNHLTGNDGLDLLTGRLGADVFFYLRLGDSPPGAGRDKIIDFEVGVDTIDVSAIDAKTGPANQRFTFIGTAAFHGIKGELRVAQSGASAIIMGDVTADGNADFELELLNTSASALSAADFRR